MLRKNRFGYSFLCANYRFCKLRSFKIRFPNVLHPYFLNIEYVIALYSVHNLGPVNGSLTTEDGSLTTGEVNEKRSCEVFHFLQWHHTDKWGSSGRDNFDFRNIFGI